jgi:hypothetical protein
MPKTRSQTKIAAAKTQPNPVQPARVQPQSTPVQPTAAQPTPVQSTRVVPPPKAKKVALPPIYNREAILREIELNRPKPTSYEFPPGYGDINIQSSNGIVISFHRDVLTRESPVFKEMLSSSETKSDTPLTLPEPSTTIEHLLSFIDPKKVPRPLTKDTIVRLLDATKKYQVAKVIAEFEDMAANPRGGLHSLCAREPMLILSLAERFGMRRLGAFTMAQAIKAHQDKVCTAEYPVSRTAYAQLMKERAQRVTWLSDKVNDAINRMFLVEKKLSRPRPKTKNEPRILLASEQLKYLEHKDAERTRHCENCSDSLIRSLMFMASRLPIEPSWSSLLLVLNKDMGGWKCPTCGSHFREDALDEYRRLNTAPVPPPQPTKLQAFSDLRDDVLYMESTPVPLRSLLNLRA